MTRPTVLTIGHSNHTVERFVRLLVEHKVEVLADARSQPFSRYVPHFNRDPLKRALEEGGIKYVFMGDEIGGRPQASDCYDAQGNVLYPAIEEKDFYRHGIDRLLEGAAKYRVCVLCSEEDPVHCHRWRLVSRTLVARGVDVCHIRGDGRLEADTEVDRRFRLLEPADLQLDLFGNEP